MDGQYRKVNKIWFYGVGNTSKFTKDFVKDYNKDSDKEHFLKLILNIPRNYVTLTMFHHFYLKEWKLQILKDL